MGRVNILTHEYELFIIKCEENIQDMEKGFIHIVNHLRTLDRTFQNEDIINKVLRCPNYSCQSKVVAIFEYK